MPGVPEPPPVVVPDDVREAELADLAIRAHTEPVAATADLLAIEAVDAATAAADYVEARRLGLRGAQDAAAALERMRWIHQRAAVLLDALRRAERPSVPRGISTVFVARD